MSQKPVPTPGLAELWHAADRTRMVFAKECRNMQHALDTARQQVRQLDKLHERMEQHHVELVCRRIGDTSAAAPTSTPLASAGSR